MWEDFQIIRVDDAVNATQYDSIQNLLQERKELKYIYCLDKNLLEAVLEFLEPFKVASEKACVDSAPTLHLVVPLVQRLTTFCSKPDDHLSLEPMRKAALNSLSAKVRVDVLHDVASFLNPVMKGLSFLSGTRHFSTKELLCNIHDIQHLCVSNIYRIYMYSDLKF